MSQRLRDIWLVFCLFGFVVVVIVGVFFLVGGYVLFVYFYPD